MYGQPLKNTFVLDTCMIVHVTPVFEKNYNLCLFLYLHSHLSPSLSSTKSSTVQNFTFIRCHLISSPLDRLVLYSSR